MALFHKLNRGFWQRHVENSVLLGIRLPPVSSLANLAIMPGSSGALSDLFLSTPLWEGIAKLIPKLAATNAYINHCDAALVVLRKVWHCHI